MLALAVRGLRAQKRMFAGTFLAVVLGVAFLSGALALGDTVTANFSKLFTSAGAGTSAVVRSATAVGSQIEAPRALIPASLLTTVRSVPGVADAQPSITGYGQILGADGNAVGGNGPPRGAGNWVTDPALNPYRIVQGRAPRSADEVVINRGAATSGHLRVGDVTTVETPQPIRARIVGLADFGTAPGFGQATFTAFTLQAAEKYLTQPGKISEVLVAAAPGISQPELVSRVARVLPPGVQVISGTAVIRENTDAVNSQFLGFLNDFLLVFAAIALLVAVLTIANTFSILVVQRTRESALLRTVGAVRRQVLGMVLTEAVIVGALASAVGLAAGLGLAGLLKGVFDRFGFALPPGVSICPSVPSSWRSGRAPGNRRRRSGARVPGLPGSAAGRAAGRSRRGQHRPPGKDADRRRPVAPRPGRGRHRSGREARARWPTPDRGQCRWWSASP